MSDCAFCHDGGHETMATINDDELCHEDDHSCYVQAQIVNHSSYPRQLRAFLDLMSAVPCAVCGDEGHTGLTGRHEVEASA